MKDHEFTDGRGVDFRDVRRLHLLPERVRDWPRVSRVQFAGLRALYRSPGTCTICTKPLSYGEAECHHLTGGTKGRSDERCNLIKLCRFCHDEVQSQRAAHQRVWLAKFQAEPWDCDWVRLILLFGRWPDFDSLI